MDAGLHAVRRAPGGAEDGMSEKVEAEWVEAWSGGGGWVAGWCVCRAIRGEDGVLRIERGAPVYVHETTPELATIHGIYLRAEAALRRVA